MARGKKGTGQYAGVKLTAAQKEKVQAAFRDAYKTLNQELQQAKAIKTRSGNKAK